MIKTILGALCVFMAVNLFMYGFLTFIKWNGDLSTWHGDERLFMAMMGIIFGGGSASAYVVFKNEKNGQ
jgi:hypothetical protein